jgi:hypothetical protein
MKTDVDEQALTVSIVSQCRDTVDDFTLPPWSTAVLWEEVNQSLAIHLRLYHDHLIRARTYARLIQKDFWRIYPLMDELCLKTCPTCRRTCCRRAKPYFDFRDLVYLHFCNIQPPYAQPIKNADDKCRYLTSRGCDLPREKRPWICTWYICPDQKRLWENDFFVKGQAVDMALARIKAHRKILEGEFVSKVTEGIRLPWNGI